jgi:PAS domain-containing protein
MTDQHVRNARGLRPDAPPRVGRFIHNPIAGTWDWDDEVFRIHGLAPGAIAPTTDYVLQCKHPEDRDRVAGVLAQAAATGEPFSVAYRLIRADGAERKVVLVCEGGVREDDAVTTIEGYYIDLTDDFEHEAAERARIAVVASAEHRATIEQAKGVLMLAYGLMPDQAFAMLNWWSRNRNVKIRDLAQQVVIVGQSGDMANRDLRVAFDNLFSDAAPTA